MSDFGMERVFRAYDEKAGVCIEVGPDSDVGGYVEIRTVGQKNEEYFGPLRLVLPPALALVLAAAITESATALAKENP